MIGYNKVNFENLPSENTPISAENLDVMDQGIFDLDNAIEVNPASIATDELKSIRFDDTIYKIAGGHELVNASGSTMTQRSKMSFPDSHLTDDSGNNQTIVDIVKEVTTAQWNNATEEGLYYINDKPDSIITAEQVAYGNGNVKTALDNTQSKAWTETARQEFTVAGESKTFNINLSNYTDVCLCPLLSGGYVPYNPLTIPASSLLNGDDHYISIYESTTQYFRLKCSYSNGVLTAKEEAFNGWGARGIKIFYR